MTTLVITYRPRPDRAEENQRLVEAVYAELADRTPPGFRYTTVRLDDGRFVHLAEIEGDNPLTSSPAFAAFQAGIAERCEPGEGPDARLGRVIGSYPDAG